ncbi:MAG: helix-turn-helix transcriptional regulator [Rhizobiaceae bacterium]|nr:helix-turn-helix transcriptional regulator [Rhizobiaceae bacterium]
MTSLPEPEQDSKPWRRSPFGSVAAGAEGAPTITLQDAVRRCRWIAVDLAADGFSLLYAGSGLDSARLAPCFDADYPAISAATRRLADGAREELARHAARSSVPRWWTSDPQCHTAITLAGIVHVEATAPQTPGRSALAFPVHADRGQCGVVVFFGDAMQVTPDDLYDFHGRCYALFEAVARIRPDSNLPMLTRREQECLKLTANGCTSEDIARLLKLSVHTTNQYLANTTQKLNAVNRMHAVAKALRLGIID